MIFEERARGYLIRRPSYWQARAVGLGFPAKRRNCFAIKQIFAENLAFCSLVKNAKIEFFFAKFYFLLFRKEMRNFRKIRKEKIATKKTCKLQKKKNFCEFFIKLLLK